MGFLDWMRNRGSQATSKRPEREVYLSFGERAALKRLVQHFDDGLIGWQGGKPRAWEADLEVTATRLGFRDPFGQEPVRIGQIESEALSKFQQACEQDTAFGSSQVKSDIQALKSALERKGKPRELPSWELKSEPQEFSPSVPQSKAVKEPGQPFERGDRVIAHEPYYYGGRPKSNPETPGIVDGVYDGGRLVSYHRKGMVPGNVPVENIRHASEQDLKKHHGEFATLEAKVQQESRGLSWDR